MTTLRTVVKNGLSQRFARGKGMLLEVIDFLSDKRYVVNKSCRVIVGLQVSLAESKCFGNKSGSISILK